MSIEPAVSTINNARSAAAQPLSYFCDPVLGDNGALYVSEFLIPLSRGRILPLPAAGCAHGTFAICILTSGEGADAQCVCAGSAGWRAAKQRGRALLRMRRAARCVRHSDDLRHRRHLCRAPEHRVDVRVAPALRQPVGCVMTRSVQRRSAPLSASHSTPTCCRLASPGPASLGGEDLQAAAAVALGG